MRQRFFPMRKDRRNYMGELQEYKCPCCGGGIRFDSKAQKLKCPFCDTEFEMEACSSTTRP